MQLSFATGENEMKRTERIRVLAETEDQLFRGLEHFVTVLENTNPGRLRIENVQSLAEIYKLCREIYRRTPV